MREPNMKIMISLALALAALVGYLHWQQAQDEAAFAAMGEAQMLREQLREPEQTK